MKISLNMTIIPATTHHVLTLESLIQIIITAK